MLSRKSLRFCLFYHSHPEDARDGGKLAYDLFRCRLLVDEKAVLDAVGTGKIRKYVSDFPNPVTAGKEGCIVIPHLGASISQFSQISSTLRTCFTSRLKFHAASTETYGSYPYTSMIIWRTGILSTVSITRNVTWVSVRRQDVLRSFKRKWNDCGRCVHPLYGSCQ